MKGSCRAETEAMVESAFVTDGIKADIASLSSAKHGQALGD